MKKMDFKDCLRTPRKNGGSEVKNFLLVKSENRFSQKSNLKKL